MHTHSYIIHAHDNSELMSREGAGVDRQVKVFATHASLKTRAQPLEPTKKVKEENQGHNVVF